MDNERYHAFAHREETDTQHVYDTEKVGDAYTYNPHADNVEKRGKNRHFKVKSFLSLLVIVLSLALLISYAFDAKGFFRKVAEEEGQHGQNAHTVVAESSKGPKHMGVYPAAVSNNAEQEALSIVEISKIGKPSVVAITTERNVDINFFYQIPMPVAGSGFFISEDGYIATNNHVVERAKDIKVHTDDGNLYDAKIIGTDPYSDLAVIKIEPLGQDKFPAVTFGHSDKLEVGELAVAIGNPAGILEGSVTAGIISALERTINVDGLELKVLQTDAAINGGNSGGALFNSFGEVIGVNTAKLSGDGRSSIEGISFAIPSDVACPILDDLMKNGEVTSRVQIGIVGKGFDADFAKLYNIADRPGILISTVVRGSAADEAGLKAGDFLVELDGKAADSITSVNAMKKDWKNGDTIEIVYFRQGKKITGEMSFIAVAEEPTEPEESETSSEV